MKDNFILKKENGSDLCFREGSNQCQEAGLNSEYELGSYPGWGVGSNSYQVTG